MSNAQIYIYCHCCLVYSCTLHVNSIKWTLHVPCSLRCTRCLAPHTTHKPKPHMSVRAFVLAQCHSRVVTARPGASCEVDGGLCHGLYVRRACQSQTMKGPTASRCWGVSHAASFSPPPCFGQPRSLRRRSWRTAHGHEADCVYCPQSTRAARPTCSGIENRARPLAFSLRAAVCVPALASD